MSICFFILSAPAGTVRKGWENLAPVPYFVGLGYIEQGLKGCSCLVQLALWAEESKLCFPELKHV